MWFLNERIVYFGQDVNNIAARIQGLAEGDEICISQAVMESPGLRDRGGPPASSDYVAVRSVGEKVETHRIAVE